MIVIYIGHFVTGLQQAQKTVPGAQITFIDVDVENNGQQLASNKLVARLVKMPLS